VRGYLGVSVTPVTPEARRASGTEAATGALVAETVPGSPAASAGINTGDIIVAFQGERIQNPHDLTRRVAGTPPGSKVTLRVARGGRETSVDATLGRLKDTPRPSGGER